MPSEREIDSYINNMEKENEIYIDKELEYADKCHSFEEEIDCPLECMVASFKAIKQNHIYCDIGNGVYELHNFRLDYIDILDDEESYMGHFTRSEYHYVLIDYADDDYFVFVENYKKTWWLKKDKCE